jgi:hypothetical protein
MSYRNLFALFSLIGLSFSSFSSSNADVIYDENIDGTLSTDNLLPTPLGTLAIGVSSVKGAIESALFQGNVDVFSFQIAPGTTLTEIRIPIYQSSDAIAVLGINNANFFPFDPSTFDNTLTLTELQQIIGVAQFGDGWDNTVNSTARDLLASVDSNLTNANLIGSRTSGFKAFENYGPNDKFDQLGPGTYTVYMQQTGANTEYQIDFTVVPEPSSFALVGLFAAAAFVRKRR